MRAGKDDAREWLEQPSLTPEQKAVFMEQAMMFGPLKRTVDNLRDSGMFASDDAEFQYMVYCVNKGAAASNDAPGIEWRDTEHYRQCRILWGKLQDMVSAEEAVDPSSWEELQERGYAPRAGIDQ